MNRFQHFMETEFGRSITVQATRHGITISTVTERIELTAGEAGRLAHALSIAVQWDTQRAHDQHLIDEHGVHGGTTTPVPPIAVVNDTHNGPQDAA